MADSPLNVPGDVNVVTLEIKSVGGEIINIKNFFGEMNIYEDMYSNALHGTLLVSDSQNLISKIPIVGTELLNVDIVTPGFGEGYEERIKKTFVIYSIRGRSLNEDRDQTFMLYFCSAEAVDDNITRLSKRFEGTTDEIVEKIFVEYIEKPRYVTNAGNTEPKADDMTPLVIADAPHKSKIAFVSTYWSPFKILNWLARRTIGAKNSAPSFLFYETTKCFYYTSLDNLIVAQLGNPAGASVFSQYKFQKKPTSPDAVGKPTLDDAESPPFKVSKPDLDNGFNIVEEIKFPKQIDILASQDMGHFASSVGTYDLIKKESFVWNHDYTFYFETIKHMENFKISKGRAVFSQESLTSNMTYPFNVPRSVESKRFFQPIYSNNLWDDKDSIDLKPEEWLSQRQSILADMNTLKIEILVAGRTDAEVGKMINLLYPTVGDKVPTDDTNSLWDPLISGTYMITAINHKITPIRHTMNMEIAKDSFRTPIVEIERQ